MTTERLSRIRAIYEAALEQAAAERSVFLDRESQGDEEIRREVELLLHARELVPDWLGEPLLAPAKPILGSPDPVLGMEGRQIGGYQLVREIGRGGVGSVYLAERVDGAFRKQVAIKFVRPGMNSAEIVEPFSRSARFLPHSIIPILPGLSTGGLRKAVSPTS